MWQILDGGDACFFVVVFIEKQRGRSFFSNLRWDSKKEKKVRRIKG